MPDTTTYTPDVQAMREAYRFHVRTIDNARYARAGREPMTDEEIDAEFDRFMSKIQGDAWDAGAATGAEVGMDAISLNPMRANW